MWFVLLLLTVDIFAVGYASKNKVLGASIYNIGHSFIFPALSLVLGVILKNNVLIGGGLIWVTHISMDRTLGYGLKLETGFKDTHLGKIGKS